MRIFVRPLAAGVVVVTGDEHHYLAYVRRARPGDEVELVDGDGRRAQATIMRIDAAQTTLEAGAPERVPAAPPHVRVLVPLIKGDRMDLCVEKLVEVGADELVVWPAARSVVRLPPERRAARLAHFQAEVQAAARQSGRAALPEIALAGTLAEALDALPAGGARIVLHPGADRAATPTVADITLISGPEGGLAPAELDLLSAAGFTHVGLGPRTLRAETAPVVAVALIRAATHS